MARKDTRRPMDAVVKALLVARVRALRTALLALHKALIDAERRRYERVNGRIENAQTALRLVLDDPWFRWLHPLAAVIVQIDEKLADEAALDAAAAEAFADRVRALLQQEGGGPEFRNEYQRSLQDTPDVVMAHARAFRVLSSEF